MSLYASTFYANEFFGGNAPAGGPGNLTAYQNNIDTVVLYWRLEPANAYLSNFVWTVNVDLSSAFGSPNQKTYVSTDSSIILAGPLVTGNTISVTVDGFAVSATFSIDSPTTLGALASAIAARPNVGLASVNGNSVIVRALNIEIPVVLTALSITGGASQASGTAGNIGALIQGRINSGMVIGLPYQRMQGIETPMYWQVKGTRGGADTVYVSSVFSIPQTVDGSTRDKMLDFQPDPIYRKDSGSNNYKILQAYGSTVDNAYVNIKMIDNDIYTASVRDASLQPLFADYIGISLPTGMKAIDYREIVRAFFVAARLSPTDESVIGTVDAALGIKPTISLIRDGIDLEVADATVGQLVDSFYVTDNNFYQTITFSAALVTGNTYSITVNGNLVSIPFGTDSDTTMASIATSLATQPGIGFAAVVQDAPGADRIVVLRASNPLAPPVLTSSIVTGGASQATTTVVSSGPVLPATTWNNVHLASGIIVNVMNPLSAIVSKLFLQSILRKLVLANTPLYVTGIV